MRWLDYSAAVLGLVVLSPLLLALASLVKLYSPGPVFYRSLRVGQGGRLFKLYKFRTMVPDAERLGPGITGHRDARVTRVGRWLRKWKLDELPQLLNVLAGEMALVGPRPEDPRYVEYYQPGHAPVLEVRPGITGAASLIYRNEEEALTDGNWEDVYITRVLPAKLSIELEYLRRRTAWTDLKLVFETFGVVFRLRAAPGSAAKQARAVHLPMASSNQEDEVPLADQT